MQNRQTKIIFPSTYDVRQIQALLPNLILKQENQKPNLCVNATNDFDIIDFEIKQLSDNECEVTVEWKEKK